LHTTWSYLDHGEEESVSVQGRIAANNGEALMQAAVHGMGITRQPDFIAAPFLQDDRVVKVLDAYQPAPLGIYAILPSNRYIPLRVAVLMDHLSQALQRRRVQT
jgi:DNA-binding transcriptional LysR family regulator